MKVLATLAGVLFILMVPAFLIASNVRWAVNEARLYRYGFEKHNVPRATGLPMEELVGAGQQIRDYFNNGEELLDLRVNMAGQEVSLYGEREVLHMRDVKGLVQGSYRVQYATGAYLLAYALVMVWLTRRRGARTLLRHALKGSVLTVALLAVVGLVSVVAWRQVFLLFHLVSFTNTLWQLDYTDYLLMMFPTGFFFDGTLFIAIASVVEAGIVWGLSLAGLRLLRRGAVEPQPTEAVPT